MNRPPTVEEIGSLCFIAFGVGAGTYKVSLDVIEAMRNDYHTPMSKFVESWAQKQKDVLENTVHFGRACARLAADDHSEEITLKHYRAALAERICVCIKH